MYIVSVLKIAELLFITIEVTDLHG